MDFNKLKVVELKTRLNDLNVNYKAYSKKAELIEMLQQHFVINEEVSSIGS
jgi:hypothetical protein